jgi:sporulation protein YlmC with PRC-barrel domain
MQIRYHELIGKEVVTADGHRIGRLADLIAEPAGGALRVTALLVGASALARRITFQKMALFRVAPPREIAWDLVGRIADRVELRADHDDLLALHEGAVIDIVSDRALGTEQGP